MEFFGLDIGSHTLKIVQLARKQEKYKLVAVGFSPSTTKGLLSEAETDLNTLSEFIKKLHQETKIKTKNVVTALPQDQVFTRVITLPLLSESELESALKWEAEQYIPLPLEEITLTHQVIGKIKEGDGEKMEVLLAAAPNHLIQKTIKVLKNAGFNPVSLETEIIAAARSLVSSEVQEGVILVDLGATATDLAIVEKGQIVFVRSLPTGGEALTRAVEFELGLKPSQAESYKKAYGVDIEKLEGKISQALAPILESIMEEIEKTIQFYQSRGKTIGQIILAGGTANLPEISNFLAKKLNLEIQIGNPFGQVIEDELLAKIPPADFPLYAIAVGLAMKEL